MLKTAVIQYATMYECDRSDRSLRRRVGVPDTASPRQTTALEAMWPSAARHARRDLLSAAYRLPVARAPPGQHSARLPALADGLLPFPSLPSPRHVAHNPHGLAPGGARMRRSRSPAIGGDHGCAERQERPGVGPDQRLRRAQTYQGTQARAPP